MNAERARRTPGLPGRALLLALGLLLLAQMAPGAAQTTEDKIKEANRRVKRIQRELEEVQARQDALRGEIEALIGRIQREIAEKEAIDARIKETKTTIRNKGKSVKRLQTRIDERARDVYIGGPASLLEFLLAADSLADLSDRVTFLSEVSESDADAAVGIEVQREELRRFEDDLEGFRDRQAELLAALADRKEELDAKFAELQAIAAEREKKLAEAKEAVKDLKKQQRREILAALAAQVAAAGVQLRPGQGLLEVCPVDPPRSYIDDFGFPRVGHTHQGNDVFAPAGTPIRAPFAGVAEESYNGLGGLAVYVRAADGTFVYNAHLSSYAGVDGEPVQTGDLIGYVGNTGNAVGTPPHDHFELHPSGGSAIDPYQHLNLVCGLNGAG